MAIGLGVSCVLPDQYAGVERQLQTAGDLGGQQGGLIEAAPPKPAPMERHRHHYIQIVTREGQDRTKIFGERAANGLVKTVFVATDQGRQTGGVALG